MRPRWKRRQWARRATEGAPERRRPMIAGEDAVTRAVVEAVAAAAAEQAGPQRQGPGATGAGRTGEGGHLTITGGARIEPDRLGRAPGPRSGRRRSGAAHRSAGGPSARPVQQRQTAGAQSATAIQILDPQLRQVVDVEAW